ncbi:DNA starvation/stationary phase protection protein [Flavobacterium faecale]|uniref:DNA starvation/stationary phase protection protein n=1 Tax=Flavobacterium faecale TaxID=1355330 RepID=A0A2S1LHD7_9FLAO|nr:DNA starvation/stationary phase protection protein [Flavobacterium faecale]AWG23118.1 DNA starvation/stationary phase protection protein [Flavobacterium faecale]
MDTKLGMPQKEMTANVKNLSIVLASEMVLYVKTRKFHWNVAGSSFMEMHKLFEAQYNELELVIDEVAERIGKLGEKATGTMAEFIENSVLEECHKDETKEAMVAELLEDYRTMITKIREMIKETEETDDFGTADFLTAIIQKHEMQAWILRRYNS